MKKRFTWQIALVLTVILSLALAGCSSSKNNEASSPSASANADGSKAALDTSKEVKLKMYLLGDKPKDFDLVYGEINKLLKQDINVTVDVTFLSWSGWSQKYPLLFASGEDFDLIYTANWAQYNTQATKGGFLEITKDMLAKYMPKTAANMYPEAWEQAKINGKVYMLPMNNKEIQGAFTLFRGDLLEKYKLDVKDIMKTPKNMELFYDAVVKNEKGMIPMQGGGVSWWGMPTFIPKDKMNNWFDLGGAGNYHVYYDASQAQPKAFSFIDTDLFLEGVKVSKEWFDKGYIAKNAMVNKSSDDDFLNGKVPFVGNNLGTVNAKYIAVAQQHPEWKPIVADANYGAVVDLKSFLQNGMGINGGSKNPERAMMMLDLFRNDARYYNLTHYGIEGKHYKLSADGKSMTPLPANTDFAPEGACPWGWNNDKLTLMIEGGIPNFQEYRDNMLKTAVTPPLQSFNFDDSSVKNELAAINNVLEQYVKPMVFGVIRKSPEEDVQNVRDRLKQAGSEKVLAEYQKQIEAYLAANKK